MQVATIEEDDDERRNVYEHDRMHLFYIGVTIVLAIITIYDRIIVDSMYGFGMKSLICRLFIDIDGFI